MCKYTHNCLPPPLYLNVDGGSEYTVAADVAENLSEDEDDNKHISLRRLKMANKKLVRLKSYSHVKWLCFMISDFTVLIWSYKSKTKLVVFHMLCTCQLNCYIIYVTNLLRLKVFYNMGNVGSELYMSRACALCNSFVSISSLRSYTSITVGVWRI